jgi:F-type H+-transporting ATPase subunit b
MEQTLEALRGIILKSIPTVCLLLLLHFYLKAMLFRPLEKVLKQREELTEGARRIAEASLAAAERKAQEFEAKLAEARARVYKEQEETRRQWLEDQSAQIAQSRAAFEGHMKEARYAIAEEAAAARQTLLASSEELADQIATAVLGRRASGRVD